MFDVSYPRHDLCSQQQEGSGLKCAVLLKEFGFWNQAEPKLQGVNRWSDSILSWARPAWNWIFKLLIKDSYVMISVIVLGSFPFVMMWISVCWKFNSRQCVAVACCEATLHAVCTHCFIKKKFSTTKKRNPGDANTSLMKVSRILVKTTNGVQVKSRCSWVRSKNKTRIGNLSLSNANPLLSCITAHTQPG